MFELSTAPVGGKLWASELLNFLEASPVLRKVHIRIPTNISLRDVSRIRVVTLPGVQTVSLAVNDATSSYELAVHISRSSASHTLLTQEKRAEDMITGQDIFVFPAAASWNAISHQYTRSPAETVTLEINPPQDPIIAYTLTFRSLDMTVIRLCLEVSGNNDDWNGFQKSFGDIALGVFSDASRIIRDHPQLPDIWKNAPS